MKYLYGASVIGIQNFIFQTDKLKEIIGASELVEDICQKCFKDFTGITEDDLKKNLLLGAAGNIRYIFDNKEDCQKVFRAFPKYIMEYAPGIKLCQYVNIDDISLNDKIQNLEEQLKAERNRYYPDLDFGLMAVERSRTTGLPAVEIMDKVSIDAGTKKKLIRANNLQGIISKIKKSNPSLLNVEFPKEFSDISGEDGRKWLAIIHADGNGLGKILHKLNKALNGKDDKEVSDAYKEFSVKLNEATINATQKSIVDTFKKFDERNLIPFRPVILGGDDLTVIIRADYALEFTQKFLSYFQEETSKELKDFFEKYLNGMKCLTACAGIAFAKESFPFHYSIAMAGRLCKDAKRASRNFNQETPPASLSFFKIQSSFVDTDNFDSLIKRELAIADEINPKDETKEDFTFKYGPYFLEKYEGRPHIDDLIKWSEDMGNPENNAPLTKLREWISIRYSSKDFAEFHMDQIIEALEAKRTKASNDKILDFLNDHKKNCINKSPMYDILNIVPFRK